MLTFFGKAVKACSGGSIAIEEFTKAYNKWINDLGSFLLKSCDSYDGLTNAELKG